jgi:hypothetical protein
LTELVLETTRAQNWTGDRSGQTSGGSKQAVVGGGPPVLVLVAMLQGSMLWFLAVLKH